MEKAAEKSDVKIKVEKNDYFAVDRWVVEVYKGFGLVYNQCEVTHIKTQCFERSSNPKIVFFNHLNQRFPWGYVHRLEEIVRQV